MSLATLSVCVDALLGHGVPQEAKYVTTHITCHTLRVTRHRPSVRVTHLQHILILVFLRAKDGVSWCVGLCRKWAREGAQAIARGLAEPDKDKRYARRPASGSFSCDSLIDILEGCTCHWGGAERLKGRMIAGKIGRYRCAPVARGYSSPLCMHVHIVQSPAYTLFFTSEWFLIFLCPGRLEALCAGSVCAGQVLAAWGPRAAAPIQVPHIFNLSDQVYLNLLGCRCCFHVMSDGRKRANCGPGALLTSVSVLCGRVNRT
jgi:hypothetical protein